MQGLKARKMVAQGKPAKAGAAPDKRTNKSKKPRRGDTRMLESRRPRLYDQPGMSHQLLRLGNVRADSRVLLRSIWNNSSSTAASLARVRMCWTTTIPTLTGAATLRNGSVLVRVEAHRDHLLSVERGEVPWTEVDAWRKELHQDFEASLATTRLAERPDYEAANRFLIRARREIANR